MAPIPVKIIVTGNSGLGKTGLIKALVASRVVDQGMREDFATIMAVDRTTNDGARDAVTKSVSWINQRIKIIRGQQGFAMDRGPIDMLYFWMSTGLVEPKTWLSAAQKIKAAMTLLDLLVLVPAESRLPNTFVPPRNEDGAIRNLSGYADIKNQATIYGLCYQLVPREKILVLPPRVATTSERLEIIKNALKSKG